MSILYIELAFVIALGAFTGCVELVGRYRDAPARALSTPGGMMYIAVNVVTAVAGLVVLKTVGADFIKETNPYNRAIYEALFAGFGSLTFLRSSIFKVRMDDKDVSIGPAILLDILLAAADRGVDRRRGRDRAAEVVETMKRVSFDKAIITLPSFCSSLMQNFNEQDQQKLTVQVKQLAASKGIDPQVRSLLLGLRLLNMFGGDVLRAAVTGLGSQITYDESVTNVPSTKARETELLDEVMKRSRS
jgi:hypothetical protein